MPRFFKIGILIASCVVCCACGAKGSLEKLRAEKQPYLQEKINLSYDEVKKNILDNRSKHGSLLMLYENSDGNLLTLVRQLNDSGEISCFFDFIDDGNATVVKVYDWICAKKFIDETIASAKNK